MGQTGKYLLATCLALLPRIAHGEVLSLRADSWCPYTCEPDNDKPGFMIEIAKLALVPAGYTVDYQILNWARSIAETRNGKFDAIVGAAKNDAPDFVFPNEPVAEQKMCFFVAKENLWTYASVESLDKVLLGAIRDYAYT